ncbi:hypothetical protein AB0K12_03530 [Nonomuraea sp. NPDC049419]|uniref:hypothetical protein n=1 Tax=Nonomuraea sp. NPDC049419 TaxID=3155772 RepID=UPI0034176586
MEEPWAAQSAQSAQPARNGDGDPGQPPAAHQRRFLVRADPGARALAGHCARWQEAYIGAVFVSVGAKGEPAELVEMFLAAGCVGRLVTFYQPHLVPELAELARLAETTWRTARPDGAASEAYWMEVAEVLAVGATETAGFGQDVIERAAATATLLNGALGRGELPTPRPLPAPPANGAPAGPPPAGGTAARLLREGARLVSLECEQRVEAFHDLGDTHPASPAPEAS